MSKRPEIDSYSKLPGMNRRDFMQLALAAGASVTMASAIWNDAKAATPKRGGTLRIGSTGGSTTDTLDGATLIDSHSQQTSWMIRNNLTEVDAKGNVIGELAESWEASTDAKTWVFKLREGVEFHSGKSLTVEDVIYSINHHRGEDSSSGGKGAVTSIESITADGKHSVVFKTNSGNSDFPYLLADYHLTVVPAGTKGDDFNKGDGTGPYVLDKWDPGVISSGKRNKNYFKSDRAFFDEVVNINITDEAARQNALQSGEIDAAESPGIKTLHLLSRVKGINIHEIGGTKHFSMPMRTDVTPFDNNHTRLALKYAIDRQAILDTILRGHGYIGNDHPIGKNQAYFASSLEQRAYDPDKAKFHLKKAGLSKLSVDLSAGEIFEGAVDSAILFQEHAKQAGIDINVIREPADGYWSNVWNKKPFVMCFWGGRVTADWMFSVAYESTSSWNDTVWKNDRFDKVLIQARAELDSAKREQMYLELQTIVRDEGATIIPTFANYIIATRDTIGTPEQMAGNWGMDGLKAAERWWQV